MNTALIIVLIIIAAALAASNSFLAYKVYSIKSDVRNSVRSLAKRLLAISNYIGISPIPDQPTYSDTDFHIIEEPSSLFKKTDEMIMQLHKQLLENRKRIIDLEMSGLVIMDSNLINKCTTFEEYYGLVLEQKNSVLKEAVKEEWDKNKKVTVNPTEPFDPAAFWDRNSVESLLKYLRTYAMIHFYNDKNNATIGEVVTESELIDIYLNSLKDKS